MDVLSEEHTQFLHRVLRATSSIDYTDCVNWRTDGCFAPVSFFVNCSDSFYTSSADSEDLTPSNIDEFERACADCLDIYTANRESFATFYAPLLFCARVRKMRPLSSSYPKDQYRDVPELTELFDACGPERC